MASPTSLPSSLDSNTEFHEEGRMEKFVRKLKQEPLIPFGCALTCWALFNASKSIRAGDHHRTNRMFRARIYAQAFTLVCMVGGSVYYAEERKKRKEFDSTVSERRAREKQDAWIRELEARDREEKEMQARRQAMVAARERGQASGHDASLVNNVKQVLEDSECRRLGVLEAIMELRPRWS